MCFQAEPTTKEFNMILYQFAFIFTQFHPNIKTSERKVDIGLFTNNVEKTFSFLFKMADNRIHECPLLSVMTTMSMMQIDGHGDCDNDVDDRLSDDEHGNDRGPMIVRIMIKFCTFS